MKAIPPAALLMVYLSALAPLSVLAQFPNRPPAAAPVAPAGMRAWTTTEGRVFQASVVKVEPTQVILRLGTGQVATLPIARLSPGDQLFAKSLLPPSSTNPASPAVRTPVSPGATGGRVAPEKRIWPAKVEVDSRAVEVTQAKDEANPGGYIYRSQTFEFISEDKLAPSMMKEIARTFEATHSLVQALPWSVNPQPPADLGHYRAKFYVSRESYIADGAPANSGGVYFSRDRIFRVPFPSLGLVMRGKTWFKDESFRNDTIVHEITHQMMHDFLPFLPIWVIEGTAEYTEMLPYNAGRFLSGSHERGVKDYIKQAQEAGLNLSDLGDIKAHMAMTREDWGKRSGGEMGGGNREQRRLYFSSLILVYFFSHLDGDGKGINFLKYMDKIAEARDAWAAFLKNPAVTVKPNGSYTYSNISPPSQSRDEGYGIANLDLLINGRSAEQLQKDITDSFKKIGVR
jgi:hypothetical protein